MRQTVRRKMGFTLLEVIVILLVVGILAAMLTPFLGTTFSTSSQPLFRLQGALELQQTMEDITGIYQASDRSADALTALKARIDQGDFTTGNHEATAAYVDLDPANANDPVTLQVTLENVASGEQLSALFTVQ